MPLRTPCKVCEYFTENEQPARSSGTLGWCEVKLPPMFEFFNDFKRAVTAATYGCHLGKEREPL